METTITTIIIVVLVLVIAMFKRTHAPAMFQTRVGSKLFDLGVDVKKLEPYFREKLFNECVAYYGATKKDANPTLFAVRFFVFALTESERLPIDAIIKEAPLISSIPIIREWAKQGKLPEKLAEKEIGKLKMFLVSGLSKEDMTHEDKLATELQIFEL